MPPKSSQSTQASADLKSEQILQAVVLADPFGEEKSWGPLVLQERDVEGGDAGAAASGEGGRRRPWCLVPLLGAPLLAWTLESLALGGVKHVYLFVRIGVEAVREYLETVTFATSGSAPLGITVCPTTAFTPGDVLREVDSRALLKSSSSSGGSSKPAEGSHEGTFLLARCGYIGNLDLVGTCTSFAGRIAKEGGLPCLTTIVRSAQPRSMLEQTVHAYTPDGRLIYYSTAPRFPRVRKATLPAEAFLGGDGKDVLVRSDLESVGLDVCSLEVPALFTENFDYQYLRPDFLHGILTSDLLGKTIHCSVVDESGPPGQWAVAVSGVRSYDAAASEILARKSQPLVPDEDMPGPHAYSQRRNRVYSGANVGLARDCIVGPSSLLGPSSSVGPRSTIGQSVLGASASLASDCHVSRSHLFDDVVIGSNSIVTDSIIGERVSVGQGSTIEGGCLIEAGVKIGKGAKLRAVQVGLTRPEGATIAADGADLGEGASGEAWAFGAEAIDSDSDDEDEADARNFKLGRLGITLRDEELVSSASSLSSLSSVASIESRSSISVSGVAGIGAVGSTGDFLGEAIHSLDRAFDEGVTVENALLELKTLRMASNVPQARLRSEVVVYLCKRGGTSAAEATKVVNRWGGLLAGLIGEDEDAMVDTLTALQRYCAEDPSQSRLFPAYLQAYYNEDVVSEEGIVGWYRSPGSKTTGGEAGTKLREVGGRFVQKLMEADSESEDDD